MREKTKWLEKYAPPGIDVSTEVTWFIAGNVVATLRSMMFLLYYLGARGNLYERRAYGIAVEKAVIVYTKDGKKFSLNSNADEFQWLMENYIVKHSPNLIIGYGAEQKARYKQLNPQSAEAGKKVKRIWGIVLMCIGAAFFITLLFTFKQAEIVPVIILILGFSGSGVILYMLGKKK